MSCVYREIYGSHVYPHLSHLYELTEWAARVDMTFRWQERFPRGVQDGVQDKMTEEVGRP